MSNLFVYGITYLLLLLKKENSDQDDDSKISRYVTLSLNKKIHLNYKCA